MARVLRRLPLAGTECGRGRGHVSSRAGCRGGTPRPERRCACDGQRCGCGACTGHSGCRSCCACSGEGGRARHADPRRGCSDRTQHGGQPHGPHGDQLSQCSGQVARGQPQGDQRLPGPHRPDQDQLHPPDRLGDRPSDRRRRAGDEEHLRGGRRRQATTHREPARQHEPRRRQGEARRQPNTARPGHPRSATPSTSTGSSLRTRRSSARSTPTS